MIRSKIYWWVIGILVAILGVSLFINEYRIKQKNKEIDSLNLSIIHLNLEVQGMLLDKVISDKTNELGLRLTTNVLLDLEKINKNYNQISQTMQRKVSETDKANTQVISEIVIDSLWEGYEGAK